MAEKAIETNPLLKRPLYLYDLPQELLNSLTIRSGDNSRHDLEHEPETAPISDLEPISAQDDGTTTSIACALCKATFRDVQDQRQHVRSDFHRYNLKLQVKGLPAIDEATFIKLIGDLDESISGSESSGSDEEDEDVKPGGDSTLTALLKRQAKISLKEEEIVTPSRGKPKGAGNAPLLWMQSPKLGDDIALGVYKALLSEAEKDEAKEHLVDIIKRKQLKGTKAKQSGKSATIVKAGTPVSDPHIFLCMIGGGHFAASIVALTPEIRKGSGGVEERHAIVRAHKTFHRYTTRRKQGGSQSANDNAKGNAHSAGSSIRRYNEAALETDVRSVLAEWKSMIDTAELVIIRATGTTSRRTLFGPYDGQILRSTDKRLRGFPFSTRRATQAELLRSFSEITRLKVSTVAETTIETPSEAPEKVPAKPIKPKAALPKPSKEEEAALLHTSQLQALIRRSKAPGLLIYLTKNDLSPNYPFYPPVEHHHAPTPIHLAASTNSPAIVIALLTKAHADPTIPNGDGRTPYDIAGDPATRDAFRVARHEMGVGFVDWAAAHVPSPLSPEDVAAKQKSEKAAEEAAEAHRRKANLERIRGEEEQRNAGRLEKKAGAGKSLGATMEKSGAEKREEEARGLTPEMRARLERERRARAAEERMRRMAGAS